MVKTMIKIANIKYEAPQEIIKKLPTWFIVSTEDLGCKQNYDENEIECLGADYIKGKTNCLVNGFEFEILETKEEILERIVNLTDSSFVDDNYTDYTIHKLFEDAVEFAMDELDDNGIDYAEKEIRDYFECKI